MHLNYRYLYSNSKMGEKNNKNLNLVVQSDEAAMGSSCEAVNVGYQSEVRNRDELGSVRSKIYLVVFPITSLLTWGIISAFPVLFVAFLEKFQKGRSQTSTIGSLQLGLLYMLTVIPGYLIPRFGFKINIAIGTLLMVIGFILSMLVSNMYYLYFTIGGFTSFGGSFLMTAADSAPLVIFNKWRAFATALSSTAASIGFAVLPLTTSYLIQVYSLSGALLLLAGIILQCLVLGMLYPDSPKDAKLSNKNEDSPVPVDEISQMSTKSKYVKILKTPSFWCVGMATVTINSMSDGCRLFLVDRALLNGIPQSSAVLGLSLWGVFSALSRFLAQIPLINKTPTRRQIALVLTTFGWSTVTFISIAYTSYPGFLFYCISAGAFHGICNILWFLVLADTMENQLVVSAYSLQCFIAGLCVIVSVPTAGLVYDITNSYQIPYIVNGTIGLLGTVCECLIPYFENKRKS